MLIVVYGRRRLGKSRLIQEVFDPAVDCYFLADLRDSVIQRRALSNAIARLVPRFDAALFPDWSSILEAWIDRAPPRSTLVIDEFPYLVQVAPEVPSIIQRLLDTPSGRPFRLLLCGSSQRMMHGITLDRSAPLYGRAQEIVKIEPLSPRWLNAALGLDYVRAVEAFAIWGGSPRNWELARPFRGLDSGITSLVLSKSGVLHSEVPRLLIDDLRSAVQAGSILSLIANGSHRQSEIAARLEKPATALARPLAILVDLGYVRREVPFGESVQSTRRSLYKVSDPFIAFWYRYVAPNESLLELDLVEEVLARVRETFSTHVAEVWEELARRSVPRLRLDKITWGPASRWWGTDLSGRPVEIDVAAESLDGKHLLVGEAKWTSRARARQILAELREKSARLPFIHGRTVHYAVWVKEAPKPEKAMPVEPQNQITILDSKRTLEAL